MARDVKAERRKTRAMCAVFLDLALCTLAHIAYSVPVYQTALPCIREGSNVHTHLYENFICRCFVCDKYDFVTGALVIHFSRKC